MKIFKRYLNIIKSNNDYKMLIENFISLSILQLLNYLMPLITIPYLLRVLGVEAYGAYAFSYSFVLFFQSFTDYGFNITGSREIAKHRDKKNYINYYLNLIFFSKIILLLFSFIIFFIIINIFSKLNNYTLLNYSAFTLVVSYVLFPEWFFVGIERMKVITILNIIIKIIFTILIFIFVRKPSDNYIIFILYAIGYLIASLISLHLIKKWFNFKFTFPKYHALKNIIKNSFNVFIAQFIPMLYNNFTTFILGLLTTNYHIGIYDAAKKIIDISISLINVLSRVFFPFLNRNQNKIYLYIKISITIGSFLSLFVLLFSKFLSNILFGLNFKDSIFLIRLMSFSIFFIALYSAFGTNYLLVKNKDKILMRITFIVSFFGFLLSFPLIYYGNSVGAAINLTLSRILLGLFTFFAFLHIDKVNFKNKFF